MIFFSTTDFIKLFHIRYSINHLPQNKTIHFYSCYCYNFLTMSFHLYLQYDKIVSKSTPRLHSRDYNTDRLYSNIEYLTHHLKILQCFVHLSQKPKYGISLRYTTYGFHFNFCKYFHKKCIGEPEVIYCHCFCSSLLLDKDVEKQLFDIIENVFDGFDTSVLCKNFKLLDISKPDYRNEHIDSIEDLFVQYKNDETFLKLYEILSTEPDNHLEAERYISITTIKILENLQIKYHLFDNLMQKWMKHPREKHSIIYLLDINPITYEITYLFPHLANMYKKFIDKYCSKILKVNDLVSELMFLTDYSYLPLEMIELEIQSLYDDQGQILNSDDFMKSLRKFEGSRYMISKEIEEYFKRQQQIKDPVCYIVSLKIGDDENSKYRIPIHKYQTFEELINGKSKIGDCQDRLKDIEEVDLSFIKEESRGYHFSFCPNINKKFRYRFCNCLKYICDKDKKIFYVMEKYAKQFRIPILNEYFGYFDFAFNSRIEVLDEIFHDKGFNELYEMLKSRRGVSESLHHVTPTIMPLLEQLKLCGNTFMELLKSWEGKYSLYEIFGDIKDKKYPHCMIIYKSLIDESSKCLYTKDLIGVLRGVDIESKIYLEEKNFGRKPSIFEGNKEQVIEEILNYEFENDIFHIKKFKIDDDDEAIYYTVPYTSIIVFEDPGSICGYGTTTCEKCGEKISRLRNNAINLFEKDD